MDLSRGHPGEVLDSLNQMQENAACPLTEGGGEMDLLRRSLVRRSFRRDLRAV
jgi:hypothetical protein